MERDEVLTRLRRHESELRSLGVTTLALFGSTARDEARPDSDVDLVVEIDDQRFSLIELIALRNRIGELLGVEADVMTPGSLHTLIRDRVLETALPVF